ncbi:hypothetical protein TNCV_3808191 [Trichonephila clavipes]|nr:hypothetical protein TNCV_3808191 [Trichonephila clavipes]
MHTRGLYRHQDLNLRLNIKNVTLQFSTSSLVVKVPDSWLTQIVAVKRSIIIHQLHHALSFVSWVPEHHCRTG